MKPHELLLVTPALLMLASCQDARMPTSLRAFNRRKTRGSWCSSMSPARTISDVCGRLYEEHGGACLDLTEFG